MNHIIGSIGALILAVLLACKPKSESATQSLDNFAAASGKVILNSCKGDYPAPVKALVVKGPAASQATSAALDVLTAIPPAMHSALVDAGVTIEISRSAPERCLDLAGGKFEATFGQTPSLAQPGMCFGGDGERVTLLVADDPVFIRHILLRGLAGIYATRIGPKVDAGWSVKTTALVRAFLKDVESSKGKYSIAKYGNMLERNNPVANLSFSLYVVAEAMDSALCSPRTRSVMAEDFARSEQAFVPMKRIVATQARLPEGFELTARPASLPRLVHVDLGSVGPVAFVERPAGLALADEYKPYQQPKLYGDVFKKQNAQSVIKTGASVIQGYGDGEGSLATDSIDAAVTVGSVVLPPWRMAMDGTAAVWMNTARFGGDLTNAEIDQFNQEFARTQYESGLKREAADEATRAAWAQADAQFQQASAGWDIKERSYQEALAVSNTLNTINSSPELSQRFAAIDYPILSDAQNIAQFGPQMTYGANPTTASIRTGTVNGYQDALGNNSGGFVTRDRQQAVDILTQMSVGNQGRPLSVEQVTAAFDRLDAGTAQYRATGELVADVQARELDYQQGVAAGTSDVLSQWTSNFDQELALGAVANNARLLERTDAAAYGMVGASATPETPSHTSETFGQSEFGDVGNPADYGFGNNAQPSISSVDEFGDVGNPADYGFSNNAEPSASSVEQGG